MYCCRVQSAIEPNISKCLQLRVRFNQRYYRKEIEYKNNTAVVIAYIEFLVTRFQNSGKMLRFHSGIAIW